MIADGKITEIFFLPMTKGFFKERVKMILGVS